MNLSRILDEWSILTKFEKSVINTDANNDSNSTLYLVMTECRVGNSLDMYFLILLVSSNSLGV